MNFRLFAIGLLAAAAAFAQTHVAVSSRTSVTADKVTIAHDPANVTRIQLCAVVIQSTVDGTAYTEVAGSAPSTTVVTSASTSPGGKPAKALVYNNSNVGSGTRTAITGKVTANQPYVLNLKNVFISGPGSTKNATVIISLGGSGDVSTALYWAEDGTCYN